MIKHKFGSEAEAIQLFDGVENFVQFKKKLEDMSVRLPKANPLRWGRFAEESKNINKIRGDGFELFCELFVKQLGIHPHVGLDKYEPIDVERDEGVDAYAINLDMKRSAIQCKFVADPNYEFTANSSNLSNFLIEAAFNGVDWISDNEIRRLFLITTAKGINQHTKEKWHNRVFEINIDTIMTLTKNKLFWSRCLQEVQNNQKE